MALGDSYITPAELKVYLSKDTSASSWSGWEDYADECCDSASREVEQITSRQFNKVTEVAARLYVPDDPYVIEVHDFYSTTGFKLEVGQYGTFTEVASTEYELHPLNGIVDGQSGWPYWEIRLIRGRTFFVNGQANVRVTALWGWNAVPQPVKQATKIIAAETFKMKDAPFGLVSGTLDQFGQPVRVRDNKVAASKLRRYCRDAVMLG